ncbi:MAG: CPBP family intramembrane metalloprotease [Clostridiales bacterium]|nr:CPBP family intramembrane metalloprotease [Clostridiales bacterium]
MKHNNTAVAGFSLALVFVFFTGANWLLGNVSQNEYSILCFVEIFSFLIPTVLVLVFSKEKSISFRFSPFHKSALGFVIKASFAVSFLSFLLNYLASFILNIYDQSGSSADTITVNGGQIIIIIFSVAIIPALAEELYMRGALFSSIEQHGTLSAIFVSALAFASIHASLKNFIGPLIAGLLYAYLTYTLNSIWPAVLSHGLNNLYTLVMNTLMQKYTAFGIWPYFLVINLFCFLLFSYLSLTSLEKLLKNNRIKKFQKGSRKFPASLFETILSPGFLLFMLLFILRGIFKMFAA